MESQPLDELTERVAVLEKTVQQLVADQATRKKNWRKTIGMFDGDDAMQEIFRLGREIRESDRQDDAE